MKPQDTYEKYEYPGRTQNQNFQFDKFSTLTSIDVLLRRIDGQLVPSGDLWKLLRLYNLPDSSVIPSYT